jgi:hypothetical protein
MGLGLLLCMRMEGLRYGEGPQAHDIIFLGISVNHQGLQNSSFYGEDEKYLI